MNIPRSGTVFWVGVFLLIVGLGVLYAPSLDVYSELGSVEADYVKLGRALTQGDGFTVAGEPEALRLPLGPVLVATGYLVQGTQSDEASRRTALFLNLLALGVVYVSAWLITSPLTALLATGLLGLMPAFWANVPKVLVDSLFMACFTLALLLIARSLQPREPVLKQSSDDTAQSSLSLLFAALVAVAAFHLRYTAVLILPVAGIFLFLATFSLRTRSDRLVEKLLARRDLWWGLILGLMLCVPWLVRQAQVHDDILIGFRQAYTQLGSVSPTTPSPWWFYLTAIPKMIGWPMFLLTLCGLAAAWRGRRQEFLMPVAAVIFSLLWFSAYSYKEERQLFLVLGFLAILAGHGLAALLRSVASRSRTTAVVLGATLLVVIALTSYHATQPRFDAAHTVTPVKTVPSTQSTNLARAH